MKKYDDAVKKVMDFINQNNYSPSATKGAWTYVNALDKKS